jgi:hypothetical protein
MLGDVSNEEDRTSLSNEYNSFVSLTGLALIFKVINIKTKYICLVSTLMANLQKMILKVPNV